MSPGLPRRFLFPLTTFRPSISTTSLRSDDNLGDLSPFPPLDGKEKEKEAKMDAARPADKPHVQIVTPAPSVDAGHRRDEHQLVLEGGPWPGPKCFRPIEEHGMIGNMHTCALVGTDAAIDWFCYPHFDSPSIFASLLDPEIGGHFSIRVAKTPGTKVTFRQMYLTETNVLVTRWLTDDGVAQVSDWMPVGPDCKEAHGWLIRELSVTRGKMIFQVDVEPAFDYARDSHTIDILPTGARFTAKASKLAMIVQCTKRRKWHVSSNGKGVYMRLKLVEGQKEYLVFREDRPSAAVLTAAAAAAGLATPSSSAPSSRSPSPPALAPPSASTSTIPGPAPAGAALAPVPLPLPPSSASSPTLNKSASGGSVWGMPPLPNVTPAIAHAAARLSAKEAVVLAPHPEFCERMLVHTIRYWRAWLSQCDYTGRWRETVYRSALCLKLLTFEPTGGIVAAPTTSLPEAIEGQRNWDYRFVWIRDSSFVLYAFLRLGFKEEANAFMRWVEERCRSLADGGSLQIMYGLHGETEIPEVELKHLRGYRDSRPVRIGNAAFSQIQLDIYGELLDTIYLSNKYAEPISYDFWQHIVKLVEWVCVHWQDKDEGIWEVRGGKQHFVYSKVMCWVALDRGIRLAQKRSFPCDLPRWLKIRNDIYEEVQRLGWCPERKSFVSHYGSTELDASVLTMPLVLFMSPTDPRFISTLDATLQSVAHGGLVSNHLVFRYNVEKTDDGMAATEEGTFSICTFWAVEALARAGVYRREYLEKARLMFEQTLGYANHLKLYSEQLGKHGEHLGNFPQAFTHLSLISAAFNLDRALGSRKVSHV